MSAAQPNLPGAGVTIRIARDDGMTFAGVTIPGELYTPGRAGLRLAGATGLSAAEQIRATNAPFVLTRAPREPVSEGVGWAIYNFAASTQLYVLRDDGTHLSYGASPHIFTRARAANILAGTPGLSITEQARISRVVGYDITLGADFAAGLYSGGSLSDVMSFTRASTATDLLPADPAGYAYQTYAVDTPRFRAGKGIMLENTSRTNLFPTPVNPAAGAYPVTFTATGPHVIWINAPGGGSASIANASGTAVIKMGRTGTLQDNASATHGVSITVNVLTAGTANVVIAGTVYAVQVEAGLAGSSFIPFQGARASETNQIIGPLAAMLISTPASAVVSYEAFRSCAQFSTALQLGGAVGPGASDEQVNNAQSNGGGSIIAALGTGNIFNCKEGVSWDATSRGHCANGGMPTPGATQYVSGGSTTIRIGVAGFMGFIKRVDAYATNLSYSALRLATQIQAPDYVTIGDSLDARADGLIPFDGSLTGISWPSRLGSTMAKTVLNGGRDGDTTAQMLTRYQALPELWTLPLVLIAGWNDIAAAVPTATIVANIQAMAALNTSGKVLVLGTFNGYATAEASGTGRYTATLALQSALASAFGANFLDIRATLVGLYDNTNPADVLLHATDQVAWTQGLPRAATPLFLTAAIDAAQTTASLNATLGGTGPWTIQLDSEMVRVTAVTGANITAMTRNYGTGGAAAAHSPFKVLRVVPDGNSPHLGDDIGRPQIATAVRNKIIALGW